MQGNQALSQVERELAVLSICSRNWGSSQVSIGDRGLLLRCKGNTGILLETKQGNWPTSRMRWGTRGSSRVVAGNSMFLSSGDGYIGEPLELHNGSQASF